MQRYLLLPLLLLLVAALSACQLDAESSWPPLLARQTETPTPTITPNPTSTPTITPTPSPSPTPTNTPSPTPTPLPSVRLALAQQAYASGDYETARLQYGALLASPGVEPHEQPPALYWRGRSELALGQAPTAAATLKLFLEQYPDHALARPAQFNLGRAYEAAGQSQAAVEAYLGSLVPDDPVNVYIYERIGDLRFRTGLYTPTISAYQAGLEATTDLGFQVHLREAIAQTELLHANPARAIAQYQAILDVAQTPEYRAKILQLLGQAYLAAEQPQAAYERYLEAVERYPEAYDSYLALVELVNADVPVDQFQRGLVDYHAAAYQPAIAAFESYQEQLDTLPASPVATATGQSAFISPVSPLTSTVTQTATRSLTATVTQTAPVTATGTPTATLALTQSWTLPPPDPALADDASWYIARSWQALGQYNSAIFSFQELIDSYPDSPYWGQAHLQLGLTLIDQDNHARGKAALRRFAAEYPDDSLAPEALWRAARLDMSDELFAEAYPAMLALAELYPASEYAGDALFWAGQAAYKLEDYDGAVAAWRQLAELYPTGELVSFAGYWQARTLLEELAQEEEAQALLADLVARPLDYYTIRARELLAETPADSGSLVVPDEARLAREQAEAEAWLADWLELDLAQADNLAEVGPDIRAEPAFQRGEALLELGLRPEALTEFETVKDDWEDDPLAMYQLSDYFHQQGLGRLGILAAARLVFLSPAEAPEQAPRYIQRLYYPLYFSEVILTEAEQVGVDPFLIAAIIHQESLFERSAQSIADARGLMQVIPTTGEYVASRSELAGFEVEQLWLPYINIKLGAWYIQQQLGIFEGNRFAALAAYNAGPGNVLEWIKISDDLDIFVESIPFWESRTYVRRVYTNLMAYRRVYGN